jgi:hypothetical protein
MLVRNALKSRSSVGSERLAGLLTMGRYVMKDFARQFR